MAETVIINAEVDTGNSVEDLEQVEQGIDDVADAGKELSNTQKSFDDLNKKIEKGGLSVRDYGKAVKQYQSIALEAGRTSPIGQEALKRAGELKDKIGDLQNEVKRLGQDGKNLQAALQLGSGIVAGYTAFQGVTAMLGIENEDLLKTITKLQAATSTLQAIEQIRVALEKESFLVIKAKTIATQAMTGAQWLLNAAMSANPIGLIVAGFVALGTGIAFLLDKLGIFSGAWDGVKAAIGGVIDFISGAISWFGKAITAVKDFSIITRVALASVTLGFSEIIPLISKAISLYNQQGQALAGAAVKAKEMADARKAQLYEELANLNAVEKKAKERFQVEIDGIDFAIRKAQASGKEHGELERKKLEITIARIKEEIIFEQKKSVILNELNKNLFSGYEHLGNQQTKFVDEQAKKRKATEEQLAKDLKATEEALVLFEIGEQKKGADAYNKIQEDKTKKAQDEAAKRVELVRATEDLIAANIKDADERAITQLELKHQRERDALIEKYGEQSTLIGELERKQAIENNHLADEILAGDLEAQAERDAEKLEAEKERAAAMLEVAKANMDATIENEKRLAEQKKIEQEAIFTVANATVNGLRSIGEIAIKDQQKAAKFNAILTAAQMAIDSARAISGAVAAAAAIPFPGNIAAIAVGVSTVLANIATAVKAFRQANMGSAPSVPSTAPASSSGSSEGEESDTIRRGGNGVTSTAEQPQTQHIQVSVLDSDLHRVRSQNEAIVENASLP